MEGRTPKLNQYRWRDFRTATGRRVVAEYIQGLPIAHREAIAAAMKQIRREGLAVAQKVRGDIYEVRAQVRDAHYRLLFSRETKFHFLLLLVFDKNDQRMRGNVRDLAERRLREWRER